MAVSGADIVNQARKELGDPYVFGAEGPNTFDCSGLVEFVFSKFGLKTPRVTFDQVRYGTAVARKDLQPGDLIFFNWTGTPHSHVGIYAGGNSVIHAPHTGTVVKEVPMTPVMWAHADAFRRFPGVTGGPATSEDPSKSPSLVDRIGGAAGGALDPLGVADAIKYVGDQLGTAASAASQVGKLADLTTHAFLPNNIIRGAAGFAGLIFVLIGIWFMSREVRAA